LTLIPVKTVKISSNDTVPMIYIPKDLRDLGFEKGIKVLLSVDDQGRLVVEKVPSISKKAEVAKT